MADKTSWTGGPVTESDINTYLAHTGGAWNTYTPVVTQSGVVTINTGLLIARWHRTGRMINFSTYITLSGSGSASNRITVSLPVTAATGAYGVGVGGVVDVSTGNVYAGTSVLNTTTTAVIAWPTASADPYLGVAGFTAALASGDIVYVSGTYEAAT